MRNLILLLCFLPILAIGQDHIYSFHSFSDGATISTVSDTLSFKILNDTYKNRDATFKMNDEEIIFKDEDFAVKRKKLFLTNKQFKFKKKLFSNRTKVIDLETGASLIDFEVDFKNDKLYAFINEHLKSQYSSKEWNIIEHFGLFNQLKYIYFNSNNEDLKDSVIIGLIAGLL
ncbi:hypothetical protein SAMN05444278_1194 [Psychroflexus salarius]|uniref:Uncharacterized protein n=1 Tax=Psychroflexus salarius TaxID=1155689 RepID=A0A1M4YAH3_9FLAO|nr:hypothetical protein [Psychroflexus salarius]SHF02596.1 hypothetical protein SAMN05444278_1194 [Psychroflexus salarius]